MLSLEGFVYVLTSMFLFTVMTVGVVAAFRMLVGCFKHACNGPSGETTAKIIASAVIVVSLMAMPSARLMEIPLLNVIPMVLYCVYMCLGLYHLWQWRCQIAEILGRIAAPGWLCRKSGKDCADKPGCGCAGKDPCGKRCPCGGSGCTGCGSGDKKPAPGPCPCGCGKSPCTGCGGGSDPGKPDKPCPDGDPCHRPPPPIWDGKR